MQLATDAGRIIACESRMLEFTDPFAGSYCMESLTDDIENATWEELEKIEKLGGAVAAIEGGYMQREVSRSAYERQRAMERGERLVVGVNCFTGENELEVSTNRLVPNPYDPEKREQAEDKQKARLAELKRERDDTQVARLLKELEVLAKKEEENLFPHLIECVKAYVTEGEICGVLREVFGEYKAASPF
jgi:methylmalonyl-CoA mutase N-terminal domain/subunit